jgi:FAD:protein FMN transferase
VTEPRRFPAMGCDVVVDGADDDEAAAVRALFAEFDARFSRFRADSELCRVNASRAAAVEVSALFAEVVGVAIDAWLATDGLVDPTVLAALEEAGYDADFAALPDDRAGGVRAGGPVRGAGAAAVAVVDRRLVLRPPGLRLDLAGVVKGLCVDRALELLAGPAYVSAGGDLAASRPLEVALPAGGSVRLEAGALATSSPAVRRWRRGGAEQHHLIDPRTGAASTSRWAWATVCAATCVGADVAAKAAYLLGDEAVAWLDRHGMPGRLVDRAGAVTVSEAWRAMAPDAVACT